MSAPPGGYSLILRTRCGCTKRVHHQFVPKVFIVPMFPSGRREFVRFGRVSGREWEFEYREAGTEERLALEPAPEDLSSQLDACLRFIGSLNLQDHPLEEQREQRDLLNAMSVLLGKRP